MDHAGYGNNVVDGSGHPASSVLDEGWLGVSTFGKFRKGGWDPKMPGLEARDDIG